MKKYIVALGLIITAAVFASTPNSWQPFQPFNNNYTARITGIADPDGLWVKLYDGNETPEVGSLDTWARASALTYADSTTNLAIASSGVIGAEAFQFGGTETRGGSFIGGARKNFCLRSEEFDNASWVAVAGGSGSADTAVAPDGNTTADSILGSSAGDGLEQDIGITSASRKVISSVYLQVTTGSESVTLENSGSGGTPETDSEVKTVTTTWQRFENHTAFTGAATGNVFTRILVGNLSTVRAWGAHTEAVEDATYGGDRQMPSAYIPTTSAVAVTAADNLRLTGPTHAGANTIAFWINKTWTSAQLGSGTFPYPWHEVNAGSSFALFYDSSGTERLQISMGVAGGDGDMATGMSADTWHHLVVMEDFGNTTYRFWVDGVEGSWIATPTPTGATVWTGSTVTVGRHLTANDDGMDGLISDFRLYLYDYGETAATLYDRDSALYGR